jgi:hypothetical protein
LAHYHGTVAQTEVPKNRLGYRGISLFIPGHGHKLEALKVERWTFSVEYSPQFMPSLNIRPPAASADPKKVESVALRQILPAQRAL